MSLKACQARCDALAAKAKPVTEAQLQQLRERNAERARDAIQKLGTRYTCHRANQAERLPPQVDRRDLADVSRMVAAVFNLPPFPTLNQGNP